MSSLGAAVIRKRRLVTQSCDSLDSRNHSTVVLTFALFSLFVDNVLNRYVQILFSLTLLYDFRNVSPYFLPFFYQGIEIRDFHVVLFLTMGATETGGGGGRLNAPPRLIMIRPVHKCITHDWSYRFSRKTCFSPEWF